MKRSADRSMVRNGWKLAAWAAIVVAALASSASAWAQVGAAVAPGSLIPGSLIPGSLDVRWDEGAADCAKNTSPPLQAHAYNAQTYIIRENVCATFEAPFLYLLIGSKRAVLIDTGDVADPKQMPLAATVMKLLPGDGAAKLPLLVVHTHRHLDHRAGDTQFAGMASVEVVGYDLASVKKHYGFGEWPNGVTEIDLGDRTVDTIPTPGHNETEVSFYDRNTGLFFTGDFLMPARLLVDDAKAYEASAMRAAAFVRDKPVSYVLGGHIEMDARGEMYAWQTQHHPNEHALQLTKDDVMALPAALRSFNGLYTANGTFVMMDSMRLLYGFALLVAALLLGLVLLIVLYVKRRRMRQKTNLTSHSPTTL